MDSTAKHDSTVLHETGLHEYLRILYRRRFWVIGIFSAMMGLGIFYLLTATPIYKAKCKLLVNTSGSSARLGISAADIMSDVLGAGRGRSLETQIELIQSEKIYGETIKKMVGTYPDPAKAPGIVVEGVENTDVLTISCNSPNRKEAVTIANAVALKYYSYSKDRGVDAIEGAVESLKAECEIAKTELKKTADELEAFHAMTNGQTRPEVVASLVAKSDALNTEVRQAEVALKAGRAQLGKLKTELEKDRTFVVQSQTVTENPAISELRKRVGDIEADRAKAAGEFQPGSTRLQTLDNQIKLMRQRMQSEARRVIASEFQVNPVEQKLLELFVTLQVDVLGHEQRKQAADKALAAHLAWLTTLPANERIETELQMQLTIAQGKYRLLEEKLQEAETTLAIKSPTNKDVDDASDNDIFYTLKALDADAVAAVIGDAVAAAVVATDAQAPVEIIQVATDPLMPASPKKKRIILMVFMLGLLLGVVMALVIDFLDDTFVGVEEVEHHLRLPVIGAIPTLTNGDPRILATPLGQTPLAEAFRGVRSHLRWCGSDNTSRLLTILSPISQDGRSTIAANLAIAFAESGTRTLLVDADLRNPKLHEYLGIKDNSVGLAQCLANGSDPANVLQTTSYHNLTLLPSGGHPVGPTELLDGDRMPELAKRLRELADVVIIDTPPAELLSDAWIIARLSDAVLPVVRIDAVKRPIAERMSTQIMRDGIHVVGVIVNRLRMSGGQASTKRLQTYLSRTNGHS